MVAAIGCASWGLDSAAACECSCVCVCVCVCVYERVYQTVCNSGFDTLGHFALVSRKKHGAFSGYFLCVSVCDKRRFAGFPWATGQLRNKREKSVPTSLQSVARSKKPAAVCIVAKWCTTTGGMDGCLLCRKLAPKSRTPLFTRCIGCSDGFGSVYRHHRSELCLSLFVRAMRVCVSVRAYLFVFFYFSLSCYCCWCHLFVFRCAGREHLQPILLLLAFHIKRL